ncbi:MAG: STAS domain-containing protein [Acidimicrobiales bacterium]
MEITEPRTIAAIGVVDAHTADDLAKALDDLDGTADVTLDLAGIEFIDSSGLRAIVTAHQRLDAAGCRLHLRSPSASMRRLLELTGLVDLLHIEG